MFLSDVAVAFEHESFRDHLFWGIFLQKALPRFEILLKQIVRLTSLTNILLYTIIVS